MDALKHPWFRCDKAILDKLLLFNHVITNNDQGRDTESIISHAAFNFDSFQLGNQYYLN